VLRIRGEGRMRPKDVRLLLLCVFWIMFLITATSKGRAGARRPSSQNGVIRSGIILSISFGSVNAGDPSTHLNGHLDASI
jgi:hypothetical protein